MTTFAIIAGVLVSWFVLTTLVRFERGCVDGQRRERGATAELARLTAGFQQFGVAAKAFVPVLQKTATAIAELGAAYERAMSDYGIPPEVTDLMDDASIIEAAKSLRSAK